MLVTSLEASLRLSLSNQASLEEQVRALQELEINFNEFGDTDLTSRFQQFFDSLDELAATPENDGVRQEFLGEAVNLVDHLSLVANRIAKLRGDLNASVDEIVREANNRLENIAGLNREIVVSENGGLDFESATDLRDQRDRLLEELSEFVEVRTRESDSGSLTVSAGGQLLVFGGRHFALTTRTETDRDVIISQVQIDNAIDLPLKGGRLEGLIRARDEVLVDFFDQVDDFSRNLIFEFNKIHSEGQGLQRFDRITSEGFVDPKNFNTVPLATNGTVTTGGLANQLLDTNLATLAPGDEFFTGLDVLVTSGANEGQRRRVVAYNDATGVLSFDRSFDQAFDAGDTYPAEAG